LIDLRCGIVDEIRLGRLEPRIAHRIGAIYKQDVWLSKESYAHIFDEHPDTSDAEIELIPQALEFGRVIFESRREQWLTVDYQIPRNPGCWYALALKCNRTGDAIYARSFHRLRPRQVKAMPGRGYVMRPQTETGAR